MNATGDWPALALECHGGVHSFTAMASGFVEPREMALHAFDMPAAYRVSAKMRIRKWTVQDRCSAVYRPERQPKLVTWRNIRSAQAVAFCADRRIISLNFNV